MTELRALSIELRNLSKALSPEQAKQIAVTVAKPAMQDAATAAEPVHFSHWSALPTVGIRQTPTGANVGAKSKGVGWWVVANVGRHAGMSGPVQGPALAGFSKKTGKALKGRKRGRWNGTTKGQGTWDDDALPAIIANTPARVLAELAKVFRKTMGV